MLVGLLNTYATKVLELVEQQPLFISAPFPGYAKVAKKNLYKLKYGHAHAHNQFLLLRLLKQ